MTDDKGALESTADTPHDPVQRADTRARRMALIIISLGLVIGLIVLGSLQCFRSGWEVWFERQVADWILNPARGGFVAFVFTIPMWGLAWYLGRIARRAEAAQRWPPPDLPVIRDTRILSGVDAARRARLLRLAALLGWLVPILSGLWFWWALTSLGD